MHAAKAPSTQNASVRPAESASSESGAGHEAHGHASKDGTTPMSVGYEEAVGLIQAGKMGMNLAVLTLPPKKHKGARL